MLAASIGGASLGAYSGQGATELDSHANMAVAGCDCTVIATSGRFATVTPFSSNLPTMDMVEICDVAIAYDDPFSLKTYLLVMRNALSFLFLPPYSSGLYLVRAPLLWDAGTLLPLWLRPFHLLQQPLLCSALDWVH